MADEDKKIMIEDMMQEMRGLEQISKILSVGADVSESDIEDIWYVVYVMIRKWRIMLSDTFIEKSIEKEKGGEP